MTTHPIITPEERAAIRALKSESPDEFGMREVRQYSGLKAIDLLDALEAAEREFDELAASHVLLDETLKFAEAELKEARVAVQECEEGWTTHAVEQEQKAPLTKHGRAAWWAHIEKSVQHGNAVGHAAMMEIPATDVQRFLELIEAAEARAEKAEAWASAVQTQISLLCPEIGPDFRVDAEKIGCALRGAKVRWRNRAEKVKRERDVLAEALVERSHVVGAIATKNPSKAWLKWAKQRAAQGEG